MSLAERVWFGHGRTARLLRTVLAPIAWLFGVVAGARAALYDKRLLRARRVGVPVVSVGNLTVGGSGKTPVVIWLADRLRALGLRPVVVSRGYRGPTRDPVLISTAVHRLAAPVQAGRRGPRHVDLAELEPSDAATLAADEALLVALRTGCPVVTAVDRVRACSLAQSAFTPDVVILDDGFQHRRLARDLDIVIVAGGDLQARLLPAGPLRERPSALSRADVVIADDEHATGARLARRPIGLVSQYDGFVAPLERLRGRTVLAVAGIARPERFFSMLTDAAAVVVGELRFDDHHAYTTADWERIEAAAGDAELVVTTEKDLVKLRPHAGDDRRLYALRIDVAIEGGEVVLERVARLDAKRCGDHHRGTSVNDGELATSGGSEKTK